MFKFLVFVVLYVSVSSLKMKLAYEWRRLDLQFPSLAIRKDMIDKGTYVPDLLINGLAVHKDKLFIIFNSKAVSPVTLTYVDLKDNSTNSPLLKPYPTWETYFPDEKAEKEIIISLRIQVDRCDRLWMLELVGERLRINVFNLDTDTLIRTHTFPSDLRYVIYKHWLAVEDEDCENTFAYVNDHYGGIWTYSLVENDSWHFSGPEKIHGILLAPNKAGYSTIYYIRHGSDEVFSTSTKLLTDSSNADEVHINEKVAQSGDEFVNLRKAIFNPSSNTLYNVHNSSLIRVLPCWHDKMDCDIRGMDEITISADIITEFGDDMTVDAKDNLWIEAKTGGWILILKFH